VISKPIAPKPTVCHVCFTSAAEAVCHVCKTERPAYTAVKNMTAKEQPKATDIARRYCMEPI
jgi:recombinational DNA repair protein RecR